MDANTVMSLSARRAWIEIKIDVGWWSVDVVSLSARRAWIEMPINGCPAR